MTVSYTPRGVCSRKMTVSAEDGIITDARIIGGCSGNLQGISRLIIGMTLEEAISRLKGIDCGGRGTSCPDQLSIAMQELIDRKDE
ncbi:MAG: TIGR03905 family TSCPD domain-containing protein [Clostridia bacterium]|nr:TIGR03905 family TSCPD domain-containing protein [Clostridia bacterium]